MTDTQRPITSEEIHAFADGDLDPERRAEVAAHLDTDPEAAARVAAYQAQNVALHGAFDSVLDEPLTSAIERAARRPRQRYWLPAAAAALAVLAGGVGGWFLHGATGVGQNADAGLVRQASVAYAVYAPEVRHPVEVPAEQEKHLVAWLSKRLGAPLSAPRLDELGFKLIGGRLLTAAEGPAALLMYEDDRGRRLAMYARADLDGNRDTAFQFERGEGIGVFYWIDGPRGFAISGELDRAELMAAARIVYAEFSP